MTSVIGWYGPLIDLSQAASHIGHFVQLLVFVHRSSPVQYKLSKGGDAIRTDIQVGDDTRPFFSISIWQKQMGSMAVAGDVILLQNVKITRFGDVVEARTVQCSSILCLHHYESLVSKGADELVAGCQVGIVTKEKLLKVIEWVQRAGCTLHTMELHSGQKKQLSRNWKVQPLEGSKSRQCDLLSEVLCLNNSCKVIFNAYVAEIFLPITWRDVGESENENMFISRRISNVEDNNLAEDLICTGCELCGSPLDLEHGRSIFGHKFDPLYCERSSNHLHRVNLIYRPFMLYVWDESEHMPLLVRNKAAELLFGNIRAERVYHCHRRRKQDLDPNPKFAHQEIYHELGATNHPSVSVDREAEKSLEQFNGTMDFYLIWLILIKMLLQQATNSPLGFEVTVNANLDRENGKFEMISASVPCFSNNGCSYEN